MRFKRFTACMLLISVLAGASCALADRQPPTIVGANAYKEKAGEIVIQPFTYAEAEAFLDNLASSPLGDIVDAFQPLTYTWSPEYAEDGQTYMDFDGPMAKFGLILAQTPFLDKQGSGDATTFSVRTRERSIAWIREITWLNKDLDNTPRGVKVGGTLENLLSVFGITEITNEGLIYDNDLLYAEEGSEETDYAYHPEQYAIIYSSGNSRTVIEFTAFEDYSDNCCVLTYVFKGEKIESIHIVKRIQN